MDPRDRGQPQKPTPQELPEKQQITTLQFTALELLVLAGAVTCVRAMQDGDWKNAMDAAVILRRPSFVAPMAEVVKKAQLGGAVGIEQSVARHFVGRPEAEKEKILDVAEQLRERALRGELGL